MSLYILEEGGIGMKSCPMCGTDAQSDALHCEQCAYTFAMSNSTSSVGGSSQGVQGIERPNGNIPIQLSWIFLIISVGLFLWSLVEYDNIVMSWLMQISSGGFFSLFLILWSVGYIVRAISFLPGRD